MGIIAADLFITLDGVYQAPGGSDEDRSEGFRFGGWQAPFGDKATGASIMASIGRTDALLMGRRTFGKGSVQTVLPLDPDHAVKLTTARYYTPNGASIQAAGIQPDIALADLALSQRDVPPSLTFGERDLRNHLKGADETDTPSPAHSIDRNVEQDYALNEALNALKALAMRTKTPTQSSDNNKKG